MVSVTVSALQRHCKHDQSSFKTAALLALSSLCITNMQNLKSEPQSALAGRASSSASHAPCIVTFPGLQLQPQCQTMPAEQLTDIDQCCRSLCHSSSLLAVASHHSPQQAMHCHHSSSPVDLQSQDTLHRHR